MPITQQQRVLLIGGLAVGGVGIIAFYIEENKKKKAAAAAAPTSAYAYGYGSPGAYAYGYGYGSVAYEPEVYGYGLGYYGYGTSGTVTTVAATTNAMWSQAAVNQLTSQGYTGSDVQAALGVYLTGGQLSTAQETIVQSAIAVEGYPPQPGANGYPPAMNVNASGGQTNPGGGSTGGTNVKTQTGTVHSTTTGESAPVTSTDGGYTWKYTGSAPKSGQSKNQVGTVTSTTTGLTGKVASYNGGLTWQYTG